MAQAGIANSDSSSSWLSVPAVSRKTICWIVELSKAFQPKVERSAIIGIEGPKSAAFTGCQIFSHDAKSKTFDTEEEALDWLVG